MSNVFRFSYSLSNKNVLYNLKFILHGLPSRMQATTKLTAEGSLQTQERSLQKQQVRYKILKRKV